jgi:hypothetical protein
MTTATHIPTKLGFAQGDLQPGQTVRFGNSAAGQFVCGLLTGAALPPMGSSGIQFVSDAQSANTEQSFAGYSRQSLTGVSWSYDASGIAIDWTFSNITFSQQAADPGTSRWGFIAYTGQSGDSNNPVVCILDFGQTVSTVNGSLVLQCPASGLISYTGFG